MDFVRMIVSMRFDIRMLRGVHTGKMLINGDGFINMRKWRNNAVSLSVVPFLISLERGFTEAQYVLLLRRTLLLKLLIVDSLNAGLSVGRVRVITAGRLTLMFTGFILIVRVEVVVGHIMVL
jgi:hypothetical protein